MHKRPEAVSAVRKLAQKVISLKHKPSTGSRAGLTESSPERFAATISLIKKLALNYSLFNSALALDPGKSKQTDAMRRVVRVEMARAGMREEALRVEINDPEVEAASREQMNEAQIRQENAGSLDRKYVRRPVDKAKSQDEFDRRCFEWKLGIMRLPFLDGETFRLDDIRFHEFLRVNGKDISGWVGPSSEIDPYDAALRQISKASGAAEQGFTELARECYEGIIDIADSIEDPWNRLYVIATIGVEMAKWGLETEARASFEEVLQSNLLAKEYPLIERLPLFKRLLKEGGKIKENPEAVHVRCSTVDLLGGVAAGYATLGDHERAKEIFEQAFWTILFAAPRSQLLTMYGTLAKHQIDAGYFDMALSLTIIDSRLSANIEMLAGKAMARRTDASANLKNLDMNEVSELVQVCDDETAKEIGMALSLPDICSLCASIQDERLRNKIFRIMTASRASLGALFDISKEEKIAQIPDGVMGKEKRLLKSCRNVLKSVEAGGRMDDSYFFAIEILQLFGKHDNGSNSLFLLMHVDRMVSENRFIFEHAMLLCALGNSKAANRAMKLLGEMPLTTEQMRSLVGALPNTSDTLSAATTVWTYIFSKDPLGGQEKMLMEAVRLSVGELNLCPTGVLLGELLIGADEASDIRSNLDAMMALQNHFDNIKTREEWLSTLTKDERELAKWYVLFGSRTRYPIGNPYSIGRFQYILEKIGKIQYNDEPMEELLQLLPASKRAKVKGNLIEGKLPVAGSSERVIHIKKNLQMDEKARRRDARRIFGSEELGVILKYAFFVSRRDELSGSGRMMLPLCSSMAQASVAVAAVEQDNPQLSEELSSFGKRLGTLTGKGLLPAQYEKVFTEPEIGITSKTIKDIDARAISLREDLVSGRFKRIIRAMKRNGKSIAMLTGSTPHMLRTIVQGVMVDEPSPQVESLFTEWEAHLEMAFDIPEKGKEPEALVLRCLDKTHDCVEAIRAADSTVNCLNSTKWGQRTYDEENFNNNGKMPLSGADVIAMVNADPLTLIIQIEKPSDGHVREAVGFMYVHFGKINGELAVLLDTTYLQNNSKSVARAILGEIEIWISRPLGAKYQVTSTRFGSYNPGPGYTNNPISIKMLRAIEEEGKPISRSRDDINVGANQVGISDSKVWHKLL